MTFVRRFSLGVVAGLCSMLAATETATAAPMDFALSQLRIAPTAADCLARNNGGHWCGDQTQFERLMLQFGTSMMMPSTAPAASLGVKGFYLGVDTTFTTIDNTQYQWRRGTEGDTSAAGTFDNADASAVLIWNRAIVRKGLPFGLEVDASLAQAASTQAWLVGIGLKWAIVEGFRTGLGRLPDVAIRASLATAVGAHDSTLTMVGVDLLVSKPFVLDRAWALSPMLALQGGWLLADSGLVDLTPETDAFETCRPQPGHQLPEPGKPGFTIGCLDNLEDYGNTVVFDSYRRFNLRVSTGGQLRYRRFVTHVTLTYDLLAPPGDATGQVMSRQLSFNLGLGVAF